MLTRPSNATSGMCSGRRLLHSRLRRFCMSRSSLSVLLHGAGTWVEVDQASLQALEHAHVLMAARMMRPRFDFDAALHQGPQRILALLGLPSIAVLLHMARLRHLVPCIRLGIREVWALAHWEHGWLHLLQGSLVWLSELVLEPGRNWQEAWPEWLLLIQSHPGKWKALLRRAQVRAIRKLAWEANLKYDSVFCCVSSNAWAVYWRALL